MNNVYLYNKTDKHLNYLEKATGAYIFSKFDLNKKIKCARKIDLTKVLFFYNQKTRMKTPVSDFESHQVIIVKTDEGCDFILEMSENDMRRLIKESLVLVN